MRMECDVMPYGILTREIFSSGAQLVLCSATGRQQHYRVKGRRIRRTPSFGGDENHLADDMESVDERSECM